MAGFNFDEEEKYVPKNQDNQENQIEFLKLENDQDYAEVRFMYGPGQTFQGETVHMVKKADKKYPIPVCCLKELGQPNSVCPLCDSGSPVTVQYFIPLFVISKTIASTGEKVAVNAVQIFKRGSTLKPILKSVVRTSQGTNCYANNIYRLIRNGKSGDINTTYSIEKVSVDNIGLESLPPIPKYRGTFILPAPTYQEMKDKYVIADQPQDIVPRTTGNNTMQQYINQNTSTMQESVNQQAQQVPAQPPFSSNYGQANIQNQQGIAQPQQQFNSGFAFTSNANINQSSSTPDIPF